MWPWVALTVVAVTVDLFGDRLERRWLVWFGKPVASTAFIAAALDMGALDSRYGQVVLVALVLSWLGDVLLIPKGARGPFLAGLVAFLLGHVAYAVAFTVVGFEVRTFGSAAAVLAVPVVIVGRWLLPRVRGGMRAPVVAYMLVISAMVALAAAARSPLVLGAAALFYVSDLAVARQRFVQPAFANRAVGLPLYYTAQLLFAWSTYG